MEHYVLCGLVFLGYTLPYSAAGMYSALNNTKVSYKKKINIDKFSAIYILAKYSVNVFHSSLALITWPVCQKHKTENNSQLNDQPLGLLCSAWKSFDKCHFTFYVIS